MIAEAPKTVKEMTASVDHSSMTPPELTIDPELKSLLPELTKEERWQLELSLIDNGCLSPLTAWNKIILDGHNRFELCQKHNLPFEVKELTFPSKAEAQTWMLKNQLARRNLTPFQRASIVLQLKPLIAGQAKQNQGHRTDLSQERGKSCNEADSVDTMKVLGAMAGISHESLRKAERIIQQGDEATIKKLQTGASSINKEYANLRKQDVQEEKAHAIKEKHSVVWIGDMSTPLGQFSKQDPISLVANLVAYFSESYLTKMMSKFVDEMLMPGRRKKFKSCLADTARKIAACMEGKSRRRFVEDILNVMRQENETAVQEIFNVLNERYGIPKAVERPCESEIVRQPGELLVSVSSSINLPHAHPEVLAYHLSHFPREYARKCPLLILDTLCEKDGLESIQPLVREINEKFGNQ